VRHRKSASGVAKASLEPFAGRGRATQKGELEVIDPPTLVGNGRFNLRNGRFNLTVHDSAMASTDDVFGLCLDVAGAQGTSHTSAGGGGRGV
jgi:hypothetical protein